MIRLIRGLLLIISGLLIFDNAQSYPMDGYADTGIRRLERLRKIHSGEEKGNKLPAGSQLSTKDIRLNLRHFPGDKLKHLAPNPALDQKIKTLFKGLPGQYSISIVAIGADSSVQYAGFNEKKTYQPGSVAKIAVAASLFYELHKLHPKSVKKRLALLKERKVVAEEWIISDSHEVPIYNPETGVRANRPIKLGDVYSLYEWVDHALSASSNAAASTVWKEALLMRAFGPKYPPSPEDEKKFFKTQSRTELAKLAKEMVNEPFINLGIPPEEWTLGSFFTRTGKNKIPSSGTNGSTAGLLKILLAIESGQLIDEWSSLEIKKLLYMTARRIRYASAPSLADHAVYFKSGSMYKCKKEEGFSCKKYMGNVQNYMNSAAIIERKGGTTYLVALMSNVLRKNSAADHQAIAGRIEKILP